MKTKATILDKRTEGATTCFLCRMTLDDYVEGLPTTYQDYDVQREIVSNVYLDHLVDTVLARRHIPPIVLVVDRGQYVENNQVLQLGGYKILDGLQRTFRLQAIRATFQYALTQIDDREEALALNKFKFSRLFSSDMRDINSTTEVLREVLKAIAVDGEEAFHQAFVNNLQWFEIWTGLSPSDEVQKMLTLNAGHKPVKTRHQLELLFLNLLPTLREGEGKKFQLLREKDISSTQFSKQRNCGDFHFAHIISALLSFIAGKAVTPTSGLIQSIQSGEADLEQYDQILTPAFLKAFVRFLIRLDQLIADQYGAEGTQWFGREITLAGLMGALGAVAADKKDPAADVMDDFYEIVRSSPRLLNLGAFEEARNNQDLSKINIGSANRAAVFSAVLAVCNGEIKGPIPWARHFRGGAQ